MTDLFTKPRKDDDATRRPTGGPRAAVIPMFAARPAGAVPMAADVDTVVDGEIIAAEWGNAVAADLIELWDEKADKLALEEHENGPLPAHPANLIAANPNVAGMNGLDVQTQLAQAAAELLIQGGLIQDTSDSVQALDSEVEELTFRSITTTSPLNGGGDLTADRTLTVDLFTGAGPGVVPGSPGGTTTYLRADGTWSAPDGGGGGGGGVPDGNKGDLTVSGGGSIWTINPGAVTQSEVGLGNVDNTSDANKPVSTAQAAALAGKQPLDTDLTAIAALTATTDNVIQSVAGAWASRTPAQLKSTLALTKGDVGLGNVDNTSDANKPVSTATATALAGKVDTARTISTTAPLAGGGDLSANRTLTVSDFTSGARGTVPASGGGTVNFLRADGTWAAPPSGGTPTTRSIATTAPLTGGGDLSADRTLAISSFAGSAAGAVPASAGGTTNFLRADGTWAAPAGGGGGVTDGDKGDITVSGTGATWTIDANAVTNAKLASMSGTTIKGNSSGGSGGPTDLSMGQVRTMIGNVSSGAAGLAPSSGGGTTNYLRADGTWAEPPGAALADGAVTNAKLATVPQYTFKAKNTAGTGAPLDLTLGQTRSLLVADQTNNKITCFRGDGTFGLLTGRYLVPISTTTYTVNAEAFGGYMHLCTNVSGCVITLTAGSVPIGSEFHFMRDTAGAVTFTPGASNSIASADSKLAIAHQSGVVTATIIASGRWLLYGDLG